ncbi:MAG: glycoside hydrolase family 15 protein [Gemmatimonadota bacterium]
MNDSTAFGAPGIEARWTRSAKDAVGTAYAAASRIWYTVSAGVLNEVYYPTIDHPQIRDLLLLVTDGATFFHDERRHLTTTTEYVGPSSLDVRVVNSDPEGRYRLVKEVLSDPHEECVLMQVTLETQPEYEGRLHVYALLAPHLDVGGADNNAEVADIAGRTLLTANKDGVWLALGATVPFLKRSCGYVGRSDGWTDLADDFHMDWEFGRAEHGNLAMIGELDLSETKTFVLGLALGSERPHAVSTLFQSLSVPFDQHRTRFCRQWQTACTHRLALEPFSTDGGQLYRRSHSLLLAHEDKTYPGALIASLSIPWGEVKGDEDLGGYHLVWTRDLCNSALALMASGNVQAPRRALVYLAATQNPDGGFYQNFWVDGKPYWKGVQLDEVAFPILLAWKLAEVDGLGAFDPYPTVKAAAGYLIRHGPATPQERWEEAGGYSPATLAVVIAGLTCAALFARSRGDQASSRYLQEYSDFLESRVEDWTVTHHGELLPDVPTHYIRIQPIDGSDPHADEDPDRGELRIANRGPDQQSVFPARNVVDAGFLALVRYGIRRPGSPLMEDSLRVVDAVLRVETPGGPVWRRYNHDGYGQGPNGEPFTGQGRGRAWPLLTGERGHYELAAGRDPTPFIRAMEWFSSGAGLLPEQVWDEQRAWPELGLALGRPTGSAMPLMWAHAEYIRLLRSMQDGVPFDRIAAVAERYQNGHRPAEREFWTFGRQPTRLPAGQALRIQAEATFRLRVTRDEGQTWTDIESTATTLGVCYCDLATRPGQGGTLRFTFFWPEAERWEGRDFQVAITDAPERQRPS